MRFTSLELRNWRSFFGTYRIDFAADTRRNVTILVGQNGVGKTALLNAFTWTLFGQTTAGFRQPEDLFNHAALAAIQPGGTDRVETQLEFEHDGALYTIRRKQDAYRQPGGDRATVSEPTLVATRRHGGSTEAIAQEDIDAVLPSGLHPFFFFPAENIGKDFDNNDAAGVRASMSYAIDVLLGIQRYDTARKVMSGALARHLKAPRGTRNAQLEEAEAEAKKAREEWESKNERKRQLPGLIKDADALAESLKAQLDTTTKYRKAIDEHEALKADVKKLEVLIQQETDEQHRLANQNCALFFGHELFTAARDVLDDAYRKGEIPPRVAAGLLDELLQEHDKKCICGRDIGQAQRERLEVLRSRTVEDRVAEIASDLRGRVPRLAWHEDQRLDARVATELLEHVRAAADAEGELRRLKNREMEMLNKQPELISHADPTATMEAWKVATQSALHLNNELQALGPELIGFERRKDETERNYQKQMTKTADAQTVSRARATLSKVEATLTEVQKAIRASARQDVERAMNRFYSSLLLKDYNITLSEEFRFQIYDKRTSKPIGASSSEIALATFAFVGALAALMPVYANLEQLLPRGDNKSVGSIEADISHAYPVVLDAPYSPFGAEYSARFSDRLPELLPQSIVIVREDHLQYVRPMLEAGRVGAAYVLQLHTGKEETRRIQWLRHQVDYVVNTRNEQAPHSELAILPLE